MSSALHTSLKHGKFIKRIGSYKVEGFDWNYKEAPRDERVLVALKIHDPSMYSEVKQWNRTHGGTAAVAEALSRYNNPCGIPMSKWSAENKLYYQEATQSVKAMFAGVSAPLMPIHWNKPTSTSSGLPHLRPKYEVHDTAVSDAYRLVHYIMNNPTAKFKDIKSPPVIPFVKAMPAPIDKHSTRGIWGYPQVMTYIEAVFGKQLYDVMMRLKHILNLPILIGPSTFAGARSFIMSSLDDDEWLASLDFVKGDTQPLADKLHNAFDVLESMIDFEQMGNKKLTAEETQNWKRVWAYVKWYFINTPIVFNDILYRKTSGFPSGSLFTLLLWLVYNLIEKAYLKYKLEKTPPTKKTIAAGGDDGLLRGRTPVDPEDLLHAAEEIGTLYHSFEKKSTFYKGKDISKTVTLSTRFDMPKSITRDEVDLFARCCYPPGWVRSTEESVGRVLTIATSVCKTNQRLNSFAEKYIRYAPISLDKPIRVETNYVKYYRYVLGINMQNTTTLRHMWKTYTNDILWALMVHRL